MFVIKRDGQYLINVTPKGIKYGDFVIHACKWKKKITLDGVIERMKTWGHDTSDFNIVEEEIGEPSPNAAKLVKEPKEKKIKTPKAPKKPKMSKEEKPET